MKYYNIILPAALFLLSIAPVSAQKYAYQSAEVYLLKSDFSSAKDIKQATYLFQVIKTDDTTYTCRYYNKFGPMVKQETYLDSNLSVPNGLFLWYDTKGNLDSEAIVYRGKKTRWNCYNDSLKNTLYIRYQNGLLLEKRDYLQNIYTDSVGNTSNLNEKEEYNHVRNKTDTVIQIPANFGTNGSKEWQKYLAKHLKVPDRFEDVMSSGSYEAVASFLITKEGKVDEVVLMHSCEWSADLEVFKVFKDSPLWQPAIQNGKKVIYRQRESFFFSVSR